MTTASESTIEKRIFPRLNQSLPAIIRLDKSLEQKVICKNISETGVYLEIPNASAAESISALCGINSRLHIKISIENELEKIETTAITRWAKHIPVNNAYGLGMEFVDLPSFHKNRLSSYINERLNKTHKKFIYNVKAYLADVNIFGTTYFARYFDWQGKTREEFFQSIPGHEEAISDGIILVTKEASIEYFESVKLFDEVVIELTSTNIRPCSFEIIFRYYIKRLMNNIGNKGLAAIGREKICFVKTSRITGKSKIVPVPKFIIDSMLLITEQSQ